MNYAQITTSFRKEIWEFKKTLFWVPVIIATFIIAIPFINLLLLDDSPFSRVLESAANVENLENIEGVARFFLGALMGVFIPFVMVALVFQLYYFTTCLFDERRDLSVYFWRSLPVSDALTVTVKLMTGALVVPAIFMLAATFVVFVFLVLGLIACTVLSVGYDVSLWGIWVNAEIFTNLAAIWLNLLPYALWMFPVFAWLMLASMFAYKAPFLWAVLPLVAIILVESFIVEYLHLDGRFISTLLHDYFSFSESMLPHDFADIESPKFIVFSLISSKVSAIATLIGVGLMCVTYWLRVNRSHG
ncbi:hypothetical protein [uncultured Paraglaciecola sp.]|uniref:hypothetical protein n=1 Tax=uncultured Paraglaciecola sp. TaxID=1765024 RepID=UPI0026262C6E|nr:hypothetical protein [uncultured Paraglaciecola sp.]